LRQIRELILKVLIQRKKRNEIGNRGNVVSLGRPPNLHEVRTETKTKNALAAMRLMSDMYPR
jgi:hypothetical protein